MVSANVVRRARTLSVGETLTLSPQEWVRVPPGFVASSSGGPWTALRARLSGATTYREDRPERPLVIRRGRNGVVVSRECYHPRYHPAKHVAFDALPGRRDWKELPSALRSDEPPTR